MVPFHNSVKGPRGPGAGPPKYNEAVWPPAEAAPPEGLPVFKSFNSVQFVPFQDSVKADGEPVDPANAIAAV